MSETLSIVDKNVERIFLDLDTDLMVLSDTHKYKEDKVAISFGSVVLFVGENNGVFVKEGDDGEFINLSQVADFVLRLLAFREKGGTATLKQLKERI